jgi:hypothetical protein
MEGSREVGDDKRVPDAAADEVEMVCGKAAPGGRNPPTRRREAVSCATPESVANGS